MQKKNDIEKKLKEIKPLLIKKYHVKSIGIFGSYACGEQNENSDIDLLVEFTKPIGWRFFTLEKYLEDIFERKIDLVTKKALRKQHEKDILSQVIYV